MESKSRSNKGFIDSFVILIFANESTYKICI